MSHQSLNLKTIVIAAGLLLTLGVVLIAGNRVFDLLARASSPPEDVAITNITANSATVTFTTATESQALIEYGTNPSNLTLFASDDNSTVSHKIKITLLTPNTTYYMHIKIGDKTYENAGLPWTFTTTNVAFEGPTPTEIPLTPAGSGGPSGEGTTSGRAFCNEIPLHMGATTGALNYDIKYDFDR